MAADTSSPRSRRAVLLAAVGGVAAAAASALGRPSGVRAANGDPMAVGGDYASTSFTRITNGTNGNDVIWGASTTGRGIVGTSSSGDAVYGNTATGTGVTGFSDSFIGVVGSTNSGHGVLGSSSSGIAVEGRTGAPTKPGIAGASHGVGVLGYSTEIGPLPAIRPGTGVQGVSVLASGVGVYGENRTGGSAENYGVLGVVNSAAGRGVYGDSLATTTGTGVWGQGRGTASAGVRGLAWDGDAASGHYGTGVLGFAGIHNAASFPAARANTGIMGYSPGGTGVYAGSSSGYALRASGRLKVDRASGIATIAATRASVTVTPGLDVPSSSFVLLTPRADLGGRRLWYTLNTTSNTITIRLSSAVASSVSVGWLLLG